MPQEERTAFVREVRERLLADERLAQATGERSRDYDRQLAGSVRRRPEFDQVRDRVMRGEVSGRRAAADFGVSPRTFRRALGVDRGRVPDGRGQGALLLRDRPEFGPMRERLTRGEISQRRAAAELGVSRNALQQAVARGGAGTERTGGQVSLGRPSSEVMPAASPRPVAVDRGLEVAR
jgi:predicted DNA-binding protein (UPF0251 family)